MWSDLRMRWWAWRHRTSRRCANCRREVPDGRRDFCTDRCADEWQDATAY